MLSALIRFSIRYYGVVIALAVLIVIYGSYRFNSTGLDIFPEFSPKQVIIQTEAVGMSAEQVEMRVTQPVEMAISGVNGMVSVRSESIQGLSIITAIFNEHSDIYLNRQLINERITGLSGQLPLGVKPVAVPLSSSSATLLTIGMTSDQHNLMELRTQAEWTLLPRLLSTPGVADVNIFGGESRQLQIQVDPAQLLRFNLSLDDIIHTAEQAGTVQGGGFIENSNQRITLQLTGLPNHLDDFGKLIVKRDQGRTITLSEVTTIAYAPEPPISAAQIMGKTGVIMMVIGQYGANTLTVSRRIEQTLQELEPLLKKQHINFYSHLFRPADYIERSVNNLSGHLLIGGFFVLIILYVFLFNGRTAFIAALAIPVSLLGAVIVLIETGVNLNIMVLGGLAIALGEVVDDAIIDTENIFRRLRENQMLAKPRPLPQVIRRASLEVRSSVVYASFIVALVFVPLLTLGGVSGRLFAPLGISYILAILMSLLTALTLTPALCYLWLGKAHVKETEPPLIRVIQPVYAKLLSWINRRFKLLNGICLLFCGLAIVVLFKTDSRFLPELREGHYIVHTSSIPGTSLQESLRIGKQLTEEISKIPGVESVSQWAGRAERGADTYGSHYSEYEVRLTPLSGRDQQRIKDHLRGLLSAFPGLVFEVNTFLTERVDETISGYTSPVVINLYGHDLNVLDSKAQEIAALIKTINSAADVQLRSAPAIPQLQIQLNSDQLNLHGILPGQIVDVLQTAYESRVTGKHYQNNVMFPVAVTLAADAKQQPETLAKLPLRNMDGHLVTLDQIAEINHSSGRYNILHQGGQRRQSVTADIELDDLTGFLDTLKNQISQQIDLPDDVHIEYTGAAVEQAEARQTLILHATVAGALVLTLLYIAIGNLRNLGLTLINLPFALIGGVAAVLLTDAALSIGSVIGFITLFGITVRNSIMLLAHYQHLIERENYAWEWKTVLLGAQQRLPAILMTALVTACAMLPIAINSDTPGREIMGPMAAIIIGGLVSSTILNLLLLPGLLLRYGKYC